MIVLLSGWRGSGKDLAASHLKSKHGFLHHSFASTLKDLVAEQYGIPRADLDDRDLKDAAIKHLPVCSKDGFSEQIHSYMAKEFAIVEGIAYQTPRSLAILEGSIKRSVDSDYWVRKVLEGLSSNDHLVISDWRYRSEIDGVERLAGRHLIRTIRLNRLSSPSPSSDPSERDLDSFSFQTVIENKGTKEELFEQLDRLL